mgnify:CR=1 FL=1
MVGRSISLTKARSSLGCRLDRRVVCDGRQCAGGSADWWIIRHQPTLVPLDFYDELWNHNPAEQVKPKP